MNTLKHSALFHLKSAGRLQQHCCGTVLFCDAIAGVAVRCFVVTEAASHNSALFKVCSAALTCVAAHAVLSTAWLQYGLPRYGFPIFHIYKQPDLKKKKKKSKRPVSPVKAAKHEVYEKKYWATKMLHPQKLLKSSWDTLFLLMLMQKQVYNSIVTESALPTMNMLSMPAFSYWDNSDWVGVAPQCFYFAVMPLAADQEEREEISPNLLQHSTVSALEWPISSLVCIAWFYTRVVMGLKIQCGQFFFHTSNQNLFMATFQF